MTDVMRLYIDSRDRVSGDASDFVYQTPLQIDIKQESIAVLDTVLIPVSWYVIEQGVNDRMYITESAKAPGSRASYRIATIAPGHYNDVYDLAAAIQITMNDYAKVVESQYAVTFNKESGRIEVDNAFTGGGLEACYIATEWTLMNSLDPETSWGVSRDNLCGAFRQTGLVTGFSVYATASLGNAPMVFPDIPILQNRRELFIQGSLGIPGLVQGPGEHVKTLCVEL